MSQPLPISAQRWLSLLLCAITAAAIAVFLSNVSFVKQAYASWGSILFASPVLHYSFAFLAGIGIKLMLDKFYISHAKRSIGFNWRYPPVTMSVLFGLLFIVGYVYFTYSNEIVEQLIAHAFVSFKFLSLSFLAIAATIIYQTKLYTKNPIFSLVLYAVSAFYLFSAINLVEVEQAFWVFSLIAAAYLVISVYLLWEQLKASSAESRVESKQEAELTLESLEDFRKWFKDDSTIKHTEKLEQDLKVYANRITERLRSGGDHEEGIAQHIALCGPYGCGKSSIVAAIANDLKKSKEVAAKLSDKAKQKVAQQNNIGWIHSDISTWGAASGSVAHVVLSHIIDDISQHLDMCAFRSLPKHYTEALKSGGSFFQFASTLLAGPIDIEQSFKKLNDVLEVTNYKLLITLQDVDRGTGDENEKRLNDIAALLDRLKDRKLSQINFIIAMGNTKPLYIEIQNKLADHVETIAHHDSKKRLLIWAKLCSEKVFENNMLLPHSFIDSAEQYFKANPLAFHGNHYHPVTISNNFIDSIRMLKRVMRRVNRCWTENKLLGEVDFGSLLLLATLREAEPALFNAFVNSYTSLVNGKSLPIAKIEDGKKKTVNEILNELIADFKNGDAVHLYNALFKELLNLKEDITDKSGNGFKSNKGSGEQHLGIKPDTVDYLKRMLLEVVPENELKDQIVIDSIKSLSTQELAKNICSDYRWQEAFERFGWILFTDNKYQNRVEQIVFDVLEHIGKDKNGFLTDGLFEEYTKQTIDNNNLEKVIYKLVELESGEKLLERQLERLQQIFNKKGFGEYKNEKDRREAKNEANKIFQGVNIANFLNENAHKLSKASFLTCIKFLTWSQLAFSKLSVANIQVKNELEVLMNNKNIWSIKYLIGEANECRFEDEIDMFREHISALSVDQKRELSGRVFELKANEKDTELIDKAIKKLGLEKC